MYDPARKVGLDHRSSVTLLMSQAKFLLLTTKRLLAPASNGPAAQIPQPVGEASGLLMTQTLAPTWHAHANSPKESNRMGCAPEGYRFEVKTGTLTKAQEDRLKKGTVGPSDGGTCILSGACMPFSYIRNEGQTNGLGVPLMGLVAEGNRERIYLSPTAEHVEAAMQATPEWEPDAKLHGKCRVNVSLYGFDTFGDLFTARQIALTNFLISWVRLGRRCWLMHV
jgi:putative DNA methylase